MNPCAYCGRKECFLEITACPIDHIDAEGVAHLGSPGTLFSFCRECWQQVQARSAAEHAQGNLRA